MIDIRKLQYRLILTTEAREMLDITSAVTTLGWEEGDGELAARAGFTIANVLFNGTLLSSIAKLGCIVSVIADWGTKSDEVIRATITDWKPSLDGSSKSPIDITAYDDLFNLQKSQDNRYYPAGTGTRSAMLGIFDDWGVPVEEYSGPDVAHAKTVFKNEYLGNMLIQLLEDAVKLGGGKCIIRSSKGKVRVIHKGSNTEIYHFGEDNSTAVSDSLSTASMITRVKVVGEEDDEERTAVEAVVNGRTEFGIRQRIVTRSSDDSLEKAMSDAQAILNKDGIPERSTSLESPDIPTLRKGDVIHVKAGTLDGYFYVKSVRHNADERSMSIEIEPVGG